MSVNGVDITQEVGVTCGLVWVVLYSVLLWFIWTRKPKTRVGRRWKASWLIGGLPVLGMPILIVPVIVSALLFQADPSKIEMSKLPEGVLLFFFSIMNLIACAVPLSIFITPFALFGTYHQLRIASDVLVDKIVPPSKDEKPNVWDEA